MKISTQTEENRQAVVQIEVEGPEMEESLDKAYQQVVRRVRIPGFRKGKAPRAIVERYVGKEGLQKEALEDLVPQLCARVVEEQKMEVIAQPEIEILQIEPVVFKATFPLRPQVVLGDYKSIRLESKPVEISDEQVNNVLDRLRERSAVWVPVDRAVNFEDMATVDIEEQTAEGVTRKYEGRQIIVVKESVYPMPEFSENVVGLSAGEEKEFELSYPSDYRFKELAGKEYKLRVKVVEVKEKQLPELDDEFVSSLGEGFESLEALRSSVAENLRAVAEDAERKEYEQKALEAVTAGSTVEFPPILLEQELDDLMRERDMLYRNQGGLEAYLRSVNKTEEQMREEFRPKAIERVTGALVLAKVAEAEGITVDEAEIHAEVDRMSEEAGDKGDDVRRLFGSHQGYHVIENRLISRKTFERLTEIAGGGAPEPPSEV